MGRGAPSTKTASTGRSFFWTCCLALPIEPCGRGSVSHNPPRCEGPGGEVVGMDGTPLPLLSNSSPLSSPLSPSNKLPCGPIWFNFLCPLKGNETSGEDLRES